MNQPLFKVQPYAHQKDALAFCDGRDFYALLMEQGTGKTPVAINDGARRWGKGEIDGMIVFAPNGVHANWTLREIPQHMPDWVQTTVGTWYSDANKSETAALERLFVPPAHNTLRILAINWEALTTKDGYEVAMRFLRNCRRVMGPADESQRVKNPKALRTKALMKLRKYIHVRAIMSGTAVVQSPWDTFSQFGYLDEEILKTESYTAFKSEYAELMPSGHGVLRHIVQRHVPSVRARFASEMRRAEMNVDPMRRTLEINRVETLIHEALEKLEPKIVMKDPVTGLPRWRNLEKLDALIAPHSFRVLKADCLDLPDKVYTQRFFRMTAKQRKMYALLRDELRLQLEEDRIAPVARIAAITKLSQIVSGYFLVPGTTQVQPIMQSEDNPKLGMLMDEIDDCSGPIIIWARFHAEIDDIMRALRKAEISAVQYHGGVSQRDRQSAIDAFQANLDPEPAVRPVRVFVGQQAAGGTGITLTAARNVIYYSNTWSLEDRLQSEDRAHRIGQRHEVRYTDLLAEGTIDEKLVSSLRAKLDLAKIVLGDNRRAAALLEP